MKFKKLGKTNFDVSVCGFGTYRVDNLVKQHHDALKYAIDKGINLIDTSANYTNGGSEILIGNVLKELNSDKQIYIITKAGYIQGTNLEIAKKHEYDKKAYEDIVKCAPELWHSIHPKFLKDQISLSLKRLQKDSVDVFLLHNPEYFLMYAKEDDIENLRSEYYRRITSAFEFLEEEVNKGRIRFYGVSSNTFGLNSDERSFTSLEKLHEIAQKISEDNHFAVVQAPLNLIEKNIAKNKNQNNDTETFLEFSYKNNLGVLVNRPLNAIEHNKIIRLSDFELKENRSLDEVMHLLDDIHKLELEIKKKYFGIIPPNEIPDIETCLFTSQTLKPLIPKLSSVVQFREIKSMYLLPRINYAIKNIFQHDSFAKDILNNYAVHVDILLDSVESLAMMNDNNKNKKFHKSLDKYFNIKSRGISLSQKAILMINSLKEVSSTLVGMRSINYVDDVIKSINSDYSTNADKFWKE